jgi:hypothetical protein
VQAVDTYAPAEQVNMVLFTSNVLARGPHTIAIEATGTHTPHDPATDGNYVVVDAFDVTP